MARTIDQDRLYRSLLRKSWFGDVTHSSAEGLVEEIDKSIEGGDMGRAISLMKAVDVLVPCEGVGEIMDKDLSSDDDDPEIDKGRRGARIGTVRSMDSTGNESKGGQVRHAMKKVEGGWVKEPKPAPHESINPKDTILSRGKG